MPPCVALLQICGYPKYFARPLFERIVQHTIRAGTREAGECLLLLLLLLPSWQ